MIGRELRPYRSTFQKATTQWLREQYKVNGVEPKAEELDSAGLPEPRRCTRGAQEFCSLDELVFDVFSGDPLLTDNYEGAAIFHLEAE